VTVLNEASTVDSQLESVAAQTVRPSEIVIADGGSTDGTVERLRGWSKRLPLKVLYMPGVNISGGRNAAIAATRAELIAVTDAGVALDCEWLGRLQAQMNSGVDVVSGFFVADPHTLFEHALGATTLPEIRDINPDTFLPSSRSVLFQRTAWERAGGYPEWLDYCEDLVFDLALRRAGCQFAFAPEAIARFRPRSTLAAFGRQYYCYARGDGKADLWRLRHAIRYATYLVTTFLLLRRSQLCWLLLIGGFAYTRRPVQRLHLAKMPLWQGAIAVGMVPVIRLAGDVAKMLGYPVGVVWASCGECGARGHLDYCPELQHVRPLAGLPRSAPR
jgi:glycosyltransferase involved in cell wall biosynthesis